MAKTRQPGPIKDANGVLLVSGQHVQVSWPQPALAQEVKMLLADRVGVVEYIEEHGGPLKRGLVDVQFPAVDGYELSLATLPCSMLQQAAVSLPEPPAAPLAGGHPVEYLPLGLIDVVRNTRQRYDENALEELAQSIRAYGVFQNIVVRPSPAAPGRYQLAAGHRRYYASERAGVGTIPAAVRELSDRQFLEIQLAENLQREKVEAADEAVTFAELRAQGFTAEDIALSIGRTAKFVAQRAQLVQLTPEWAEALREHRLPLAGAHQLARLSAAEQGQALESLKQGYYGGWVDINGERKRQYGADDVKRWVRDTLSRDLAAAAFPKDDAELNPAAGPCTSCPKRTGNVLYLFGDMGAERCLDAACFQTKCDANLARTLASLQADLDQGSTLQIVEGWERKKGVLSRSDYQELTSREPTAEERAAGKVRQAVVTDGRRAGEVVEVLLNGNSVRQVDRSPEEKAAAEQQRKDERAEVVAKNRQLRQAHEKLRAGVREGNGVVRLAVLRQVVANELGHPTKARRTLLLEDYGWPESVFQAGHDFSSERKTAIAAQLATMPEADLQRLLLDANLVDWLNREYDYDTPALAKQLGWSPKQLDAEAAAARKQGKEVLADA